MEITFTEDARRKFTGFNFFRVRPLFLINSTTEATLITKHRQHICTTSQESEGRPGTYFKSSALSISSVHFL